MKLITSYHIVIDSIAWDCFLESWLAQLYCPHRLSIDLPSVFLLTRLAPSSDFSLCLGWFQQCHSPGITNSSCQEPTATVPTQLAIMSKTEQKYESDIETAQRVCSPFITLVFPPCAGKYCARLTFLYLDLDRVPSPCYFL